MKNIVVKLLKLSGMRIRRRKSDGKYWVLATNGKMYPLITGILWHLLEGLFLILAILAAIVVASESVNKEISISFLLFMAAKIPVLLCAGLFLKIAHWFHRRWMVE